jgi:hypothetical protein
VRSFLQNYGFENLGIYFSTNWTIIIGWNIKGKIVFTSLKVWLNVTYTLSNVPYNISLMTQLNQKQVKEENSKSHKHYA